ncbi:MAG: hypothetical protein AAGK02_00390 [Pseudomonadota bacterium]
MTIVPDFVIAARIDAHHRAQQLEFEAAKRVEERVSKAKDADAEAAEEIGNLLTLTLVRGITPLERLRLETRLADHQSAVIRALQENQDKLDASELALDALREQAYVHKDGRRIFKSQDGEWVIDETGLRLSPLEIDPDQIEDFRPSAETWLDALDAHRDLQEERDALIEYQTDLDEAEVLMRRGGLTEAEASELDDLLQGAPTAVRRHLPKSDPAAVSEATNEDGGPSFPATFNAPEIPDATFGAKTGLN